MTRSFPAGLVVVCTTIAFAGAAAPARATDAGVAGSRLSITTNASTGKQSLSSTQKGVGIAFGAASAASEMSGSFTVYYVDQPSRRGTLALPSPWSSVDAAMAKFQNRLAPAGPTGVRTASVRKDKVAKVSAKSAGGLDLSQPPGPGGVISVLTVDNAGDGSTHRMCTLYRAGSGSKVQHKFALGRGKLSLSKGVPTACPTCADTLRNGDETGVDCGGPTCAACGAGGGCVTGSDCQSGLCTNGVCESPTCSGGVKDGTETGIDCGGPACPDCPPGQGCNTGADCTSGVCGTALCGGTCVGGTTVGKACLQNTDCSGAGATCNTGFPGYNTKCTQAGPCGTGGTCVPIDTAKGLDGLPCTDDDAPGAKGVPQTIPQTTGRSATFLSDADNIGGAQLVHLACVGGLIDPANCGSSVVGTPFNCANITGPNPSVSGVRLANTFPTLDGQTGDGVVSTFLTAR